MAVKSHQFEWQFYWQRWWLLYVDEKIDPEYGFTRWVVAIGPLQMRWYA